MKIGYALSCEEHTAPDLVRNAVLAEEAGFDFAMISDHFHPWTDSQGQSPFVWGVAGAIAQATQRLELGTGVTCPILRIHPAIVAQAAATAATLMPGRFMLGVGTGERLNEHVLGQHWPPADVRIEMLEEAIGIIRELWKGEDFSHRGRHFEVQNARIYSLPDTLPPILVAAKGERAAGLAGRAGDAFVSTSPDPEGVRTFEESGGGGKPKIGMLHVCWAADEATARKVASEWWPNSALQGELGVELALPRHFEQATSALTEDQIAESLPHGADASTFVEAFRGYADAGYDHVYFHQVGPDQEGFIDFFRNNLRRKLM